jgi:putative transposase
MPRRRRLIVPGHPFHVTNRGVERRRLFLEEAHYNAFLGLLDRGKKRFEVEIWGLCLMPNHFHLVARATQPHALSAYLHWVQGIHSRDLRVWTKTRGYGHVFQQRYWSGPIEDGSHLMSVLRYVEANPVAAKLVKRAEDWPWTSLALRRSSCFQVLDPLPIQLPDDWSERLNSEPEPSDCD